jgi:hypothetical protein
MKVVTWGLALVLLGYAAYAAMMSAWSYMQVAEVVDHAVSNPPAGSATTAALLRQAVVTRATEAGLALDERHVTVSELDRGLEVQVAWTHPVIVVNGDAVVAVPLSHRRRMEGVGARR